ESVLLDTTTATTFSDTGLTPGTIYHSSVVAIDAAGNASPAATSMATTHSPSGPLPTLRINAGGPSYVDSLGRTWLADTGYNTGKSSTESVSVTGTSDPQLFRTNRFDEPAQPELLYTFALPNGSYLVRLHFAETYGPNKA